MSNIIMKTNGMIFMASFLMTNAILAPAATNDLSASLQRGLFEEEANHNLDAAIQAYQSVINQYDNDRKLAATAIFRLGESYRKQAKTNEAVGQYERVLREFPDQPDLLPVSRQNLGTLGSTRTVAEGGSILSAAAAADAERQSLDTQISEFKKLTPEKLRIAVQQTFPN